MGVQGVEQLVKAPLSEVALSLLVTLSCLLFTLQTFDGQSESCICSRKYPANPTNPPTWPGGQAGSLA